MTEQIGLTDYQKRHAANTADMMSVESLLVAQRILKMAEDIAVRIVNQAIANSRDIDVIEYLRDEVRLKTAEVKTSSKETAPQ